MKGHSQPCMHGSWYAFQVHTVQEKTEGLRMALRQDYSFAFDLVVKGRGRKDEHCASDHGQKYGLVATNHCAPSEDKEVSQCRTCARTATVFFGRCIWWVTRSKFLPGCCAQFLVQRTDWIATEQSSGRANYGYSVDYPGEGLQSRNAVPQGLCENLR